MICLIVLTGCNTICNHKDDFKTIGHDVLDEGMDDVEMKYYKKTKHKAKASKTDTQ